ncbi:MAG: hypothetical protein K5639_03585 [Eubacterium sp.]|nr:hypothetical protein [Eubacterium sp.]
MKAKRLLSLVLVLAVAMSVAVIAPKKDALAAAKTKKITLIKGDKIELGVTNWMVLQKIKSASTSKKSVVSIKKKSKKVVATAKKAGKATVTIRTKSGITMKWKITVKKNKVSGKVLKNVITQGTSGYNSNIVFEVVNKTGVYLPSLDVKYTIKGQLGTTLESKTVTLSKAVSGKKMHFMVNLYNQPEPPASFKLSYKGGKRNIDYKYTNQSSKVSVKQTSTSGKTIYFSMKNKTSKTVSGIVDVVFYDASGNAVWFSNMSLYMGSKETKTSSVYSSADFASYKVFTRACSEKYVG